MPAWAEPTPFPASWELRGWGSARPPKSLRQDPVCALDTAGLPATLGRLGSQGSSPVLRALRPRVLLTTCLKHRNQLHYEPQIASSSC